MSRLRRLLCAVPFTLSYAVLLTAGSEVVERLDPDARVDVLRAVSTNLQNLSGGHVETLLASALVQAEPDFPGLLPTLVALAASERVLGSRRTLAVFAIGHVGASVAVAGLLAGGALPGVLADKVALAVDTGPSYGTAAVIGAGLLVLVAHTVRQAVRRPSVGRLLMGAALGVTAAAIVTVTVIPVAVQPTFTAWGHLLALATGGVLGVWISRQDRPRGAQPA